MLAESTVQEIERLLEAGELPQRVIADRVGVSLAKVTAISTGKPMLLQSPSPYDPPVELCSRCETCGTMVYRQPCLYCHSLANRRHGQLALTAAFMLTPGAERQPEDPTPAAIAAQCAEFRRRRPRLRVGESESSGHWTPPECEVPADLIDTLGTESFG